MSDRAVAAVRHVDPIRPKHAEGLLADVYRQAKSDLGIVGPALTMLSPAPELLAPVWALLRESLLVGGPRERRAKEAVALAVSVKNSCRFCVEAHSMMLHALGEQEIAEAVQNGRTGHSGPAAWAADPSLDGPFEAEAAPRFIGTMLAFEIITRLVRASVTERSPHLAVTTRLGRSVASRQFRTVVEADLEPGSSLPLLDERPEWLEELWPTLDTTVPAWARDSPVGTAFAHLRATASGGRGLLQEEAAGTVERMIEQWVHRSGSGLAPEPLEFEEFDRLPRRAALGARLAAAAALDPGSVTDADMADWRSGKLSDHCAVFLLAFAVVHASDRVQVRLGSQGVVDA
ncbi:carboxymuconolactone decarboxylase family protein [Glycomyces halotolerans]